MGAKGLRVRRNSLRVEDFEHSVMFLEPEDGRFTVYTAKFEVKQALCGV